MNDMQKETAGQQSARNLNTQPNLQPNPVNGTLNPYLPESVSSPQGQYQPQAPYQPQALYQPQAPYQPQAIHAPPPAPMQPNPMNNPQPGSFHPMVNTSSYPPCPLCGRSVPTVEKRTIGFAQICWCVVLGIFYWPICLCWVPFCVDCCDDIHYECSSCNMTRGTKIGGVFG